LDAHWLVKKKSQENSVRDSENSWWGLEVFFVPSLCHVDQVTFHIVVVAFFQVISKSARKAPETMVSSMGQNVEEDPDTVRYGGVGVYGSRERVGVGHDILEF